MQVEVGDLLILMTRKMDLLNSHLQFIHTQAHKMITQKKVSSQTWNRFWFLSSLIILAVHLGKIIPVHHNKKKLSTITSIYQLLSTFPLYLGIIKSTIKFINWKKQVADEQRKTKS